MPLLPSLENNNLVCSPFVQVYMKERTLCLFTLMNFEEDVFIWSATLCNEVNILREQEKGFPVTSHVNFSSQIFNLVIDFEFFRRRLLD